VLDFARPQSLEKEQRSKRALKLALAEMYVQGVSTRKVTKITEALCGLEVTSTQVSRATTLLDERVKARRTRKLGSVRYLILGARYESVRHGGRVIDCTVLVAIGVDEKGKRAPSWVQVSRCRKLRCIGESIFRLCWAAGMRNVQMITSDAHQGLKKALGRRCLVCHGNVVSVIFSVMRRDMCLRWRWEVR